MTLRTLQLFSAIAVLGAFTACGDEPALIDGTPGYVPVPYGPRGPAVDAGMPPACTRCGGAGCVDLTSDPANCGACGTVCAAPDHADPACGGGQCAFQCHTGYKASGTACMLAPAAPRLLSPLSTATATSTRPTFRWSLAPETDGAQIDLCPTRACDQGVVTADVAGDVFRPAKDLSPGVHFWRLRGMAAGVVGTADTPAWEFFVSHAGGSVDTSGGTVLDLDGDGLADVAVADPGPGNLYVYLGGAAGPGKPITISAPGIQSVASAGDVDGDGYGDLVVTMSDGSGGSVVAVWRGGPSGPASTPSYKLASPYTSAMVSGFGASVAALGDIDGDGYGDLLVGAPGQGTALVYRGGAAGPGGTSPITITAPEASSAFGAAVAGIGDLDGDGYDDFVIGAPLGQLGRGSAYLYMGAPGDISTVPATALPHPDIANGAFGSSIAGGDINGDGLADIVVGAPQAVSSSGRVFVYFGSASGVAAQPDATLAGLDGAGAAFGTTLAAGDYNGDGLADVAVGAPGVESGLGTTLGHVYVFTGGATMLGAPAIELAGPDGESFGYSLACAGDLYGDGFADLLVGTWHANRAYLYRGAGSGITATPATILAGPDSTYNSFGNALALR